MDEPSIYVSLREYTVLLVIRHGIVVDAPPIARWTLGKTRRDVLRYFMRRQALLYPVL